MMHFCESIQKRADEFLASLPCRVQKPYPPTEIPAKNEQIANMLLAAFADGGNAELTAITQYQNHADTIDDKELADMVFCISLVEMKHLDMIGGMIESLGGNARYWRPNHAYWSGGNVAYGTSTCEKLSLNIMAEQEALNGYEELLRSINQVGGPGAEQVEIVIRRIMEDEAFHLEEFKKAFRKHCCRCD